MKKITIIIGFFSLLFLSGCVKMRFDDVENQSSSTYKLPENSVVITIDELKGFYIGSLDSISAYDGSKDVYIYVSVIGNDVSGNIYKSMYVRDENGTHQALNIAVDKTGLYNFYPIGQKIYVKCNGLFMGRYNGLPQLGYKYKQDNGVYELGRIADALFDLHVFKDGPVPNKENLPKPVVITTAAQLDNTELYNQLVLLKNVQFNDAEVGLELAPAPALGSNPTSTNRSFTIQGEGSNLSIRTSSACRFYKEKVPGGTGDITCIYTVFGNDKQFYLRMYSDIDSGSGFVMHPGEITIDKLLDQTMNSSLGSFTPVSVLGDQLWSYSSQYKCALMKGLNSVESGNVPNEDWLISSEVTIAESYEEIYCSFDQALNYMRSQGWSDFQIRISSDYNPVNNNDPNSATWTALSIPILPTGSDFNFVNSGKIDLTAYKGKQIYIAFVYKSSVDNAATWEVKNVQIIGIQPK
ncbi:MAG: DUF5689 domain-containing protein [Bacteroidales bacterium]